MRMVLKHGKRKVLTLSYDDGVVQDIRLIDIMNKHGLKGTFNLNSSLYLPEDSVREHFYGRLKLSEAKQLYTNSGHEVAVHGLTHPFLEQLNSSEMIYEITEDRKQLESQYNTIIRGMAYPFGTYNDKVVEVLQHCEIAYARTVQSTFGFDFPENWLLWHPTCQHDCPNLGELAKRFVEEPCYFGNVELFYLWGHSYEFDDNNNWEVIEKFAEYIGGHDHIWYATNIEIYEYVMAYRRLETSYDKRIIHNPTAIDVWVEIQGQTYCIKAGETITVSF